MLIQPRLVVLTLVSGDSPELQRELSWGVPLPRLLVGTSGDWRVTAAGVLGAHVLLSFDGYRLRARAECDTAEVRLRGERLDTQWRELGLPFELAFGEARIAGCAVAAAGRNGRAGCASGQRVPSSGVAPLPAFETQHLDLSMLRAAALAPHAIVALGTAAASPASVSTPAPLAAPSAEPPAARPAECRAQRPLPFEVVSGSTLVWPLPGGKARHTPDAALAPAALSSCQTVSDNGALRAYARRLAADQRLAAAAQPAARPGPLPHGSRALGRGVRRWLPPLAQRRARVAQRLAFLTRRQRLLALPSLGAPVLAWLLIGAAPSAGSIPAPPSGTLAAPDARAAEGVVGAPAGPSEPPAPSQAEPGTTVHAVAGIATPRAAPSPSPAEPNPTPASGSSQARGGLERDAFRAAFGGNTSRGLALYEQLAEERGDEAYRHAARLLRAERVLKP